ncbi:MAG: hypothetical protein AAF411_02765 [Myxococcota bacterium]
MTFFRILSIAIVLITASSVQAQCVDEPCAAEAATLSLVKGAKTAEAVPPSPVQRARAAQEPEFRALGVPLFVQLRHFSPAGINQGAFQLTSFEFGARISTRSAHIKLDVGALMNFGSYRDPLSRDSSGFVGLGFLMDLFVHINPADPVRFFVVGGTRFTMGGAQHAAPDTSGPLDEVDEEECPSLITVEASLGLGADIAFGGVGLFSLSVRGVRSRALGELRFAANGVNPPVASTRGVWGVAATARIGVRYDLAP